MGTDTTEDVEAVSNIHSFRVSLKSVISFPFVIYGLCIEMSWSRRS